MEACKKWWKRQEVSQYNPGSQFAYEEGWRAFGEWLLTQHPCGYMRDIIEKELEEK